MFLRGNRYRVPLLSVQRGLNSKPFRYKAEIFAAVGENVGCPDILSFCVSRSISRLYGAGNCRLQYNTIQYNKEFIVKIHLATTMACFHGRNRSRGL